MKGGTFLCNEKYVHGFIANTVGVSQFIIDIRSFSGKIADNKFGTLDQIGDFPNKKPDPIFSVDHSAECGVIPPAPKTCDAANW